MVWRSGRTSTPGACMSTMNPVRPLCLGWSGSVRQMISPMSEYAPDVQTFWPVISHSSPSRSALVCRLARSDPAPGSEKSWRRCHRGTSPAGSGPWRAPRRERGSWGRPSRARCRRRTGWGPRTAIRARTTTARRGWATSTAELRRPADPAEAGVELGGPPLLVSASSSRSSASLLVEQRHLVRALAPHERLLGLPASRRGRRVKPRASVSKASRLTSGMDRPPGTRTSDLRSM